jgi:hypothetical protein
MMGSLRIWHLNNLGLVRNDHVNLIKRVRVDFFDFFGELGIVLYPTGRFEQKMSNFKEKTVE